VYGGLSASERDQKARQSLMAAGRVLFADNGFAATGVRDLCRKAGVSERAFYATFGGREALLRDVYLAATDEVIGKIATAVNAGPLDPAAQLELGLKAFFGAISDDPRLGRLIYVESLGRGAEIEVARREGLDRFAQLVIDQMAPFTPAEPLPGPVARLVVSAALVAVGEVAYRIAEGDSPVSAAEAAGPTARVLAAAAMAGGLLAPDR
jgi:AcrR family transcriptional regulator